MSNQDTCKSIGVPIGTAFQLGFGMLGDYLNQRYGHFHRDLEAQQIEIRLGNHIPNIMNLFGVAANIGITLGFQYLCSYLAENTNNTEEYLQNSVIGAHNATHD